MTGAVARRVAQLGRVQLLARARGAQVGIDHGAVALVLHRAFLVAHAVVRQSAGMLLTELGQPGLALAKFGCEPLGFGLGELDLALGFLDRPAPRWRRRTDSASSFAIFWAVSASECRKPTSNA